MRRLYAGDTQPEADACLSVPNILTNPKFNIQLVTESQRAEKRKRKDEEKRNHPISSSGKRKVKKFYGSNIRRQVLQKK